MLQKKHPLEMIKAEIERYGLVVMEGITHMPVYGEPYISPYLTICLNHRGYVIADYDMSCVKFCTHDVAIVMPNHVLTALSSSDDYLATLLVISPRFLERLNRNFMALKRLEIQNPNSFHLTEMQINTIRDVFRVIGAMSKLQYPERDNMLAEQFELGAHLCDAYMLENGKEKIDILNDKQRLMANFYSAVIAHYRESREVKFYANLLCMSPKHFGSIIRKETGTGAVEWIARYVVLKAKSLLRYSPDLSIQQISHELGFTDQTAFTRYFKTYSGMTPREYRNRD